MEKLKIKNTVFLNTERITDLRIGGKKLNPSLTAIPFKQHFHIHQKKALRISGDIVNKIVNNERPIS